MNTKKSEMKLGREEVAELYRDVRKNIGQLKGKKVAGAATKNASTSDLAKEIAKSISQSMAKDQPSTRVKQLAAEELADANVLAELTKHSSGFKGHTAAIGLVLAIVVLKFSLALAEGLGLISPSTAQASIAIAKAPTPVEERFSPEEVRILTSLEERRAELEARRKKVETTEKDIAVREQEFTIKLAELRELTEKLRSERERDQKKRSAQIEQLSNVYGSMNPTEAAQLLQQLDVTIALSLIERMPEKRIGQILSAMTPERALMITKMLSHAEQVGGGGGR